MAERASACYTSRVSSAPRTTRPPRKEDIGLWLLIVKQGSPPFRHGRSLLRIRAERQSDR